MRARWLATGLISLFTAGLLVSQAALVYAADPPATTSTGTTTTTTPAQTSTSQGQTTSTDPNAPANPNTDLPGGNGDNDPSSFTKPTCSVGGLGWIVCPLINAGVETVSKVSKLIVDMLETKPLTSDNGLYNAWKAIRNLADVMFILIFLALIFGNLLASDGSSYALKSLLPKLIIAAIGVQISFFVTAFVIDIGNVSGAGFGSIISQLGNTSGSSADITHGIFNPGSFLAFTLTGITAVIVGVILTWPAILLMLGGFLVSILGVFFTLALRQLIIAVLIVLSPLAFAAWVLPNTEVYFKHWYKNLIRVILMYPLIIILLSIGGFLARIANQSDGIFHSHEINVIFASIIPILVFLAIPATFKAATGLMATVSGRVFGHHDRAKGMLSGSQLRKDIKEARQERGFINQRDIKGGGFNAKRKRGIARLQAGQLGAGQPGKRRLAKGYEAAMGAQMKDWGTIFDDQGLSNSDLYERVFAPGMGGKFEYENPDGSKKSVRITKAMQAQAIGQMAKQGGWMEINKVLSGDPVKNIPPIFNPDLDNGRGGFVEYMGMPPNEVADMWFRGMGSSGVMSQAIQTIPIINPGKKNRAYDGLSASQVAGIHGTGADKYFNRIMQNVGPDNNLGDVDTGRKERTANFFRNVVSIAGSADQRSKVDPALLKYFKEKLATDANFHALMAAEKTNYKNAAVSGVEFFDKYVSASGRIEHEGIVP